MKKIDFEKLFLRCVNEAKKYIEKTQGLALPSNYLFIVNGGGVSDEVMTLDDTINVLYISDNLFYRAINVGCKSISNDITYIFVGISGHKPSSYDKTIHADSGYGPFHLIIPLKIDIVL